MRKKKNSDGYKGFPVELFASGSGKAGSFVPIFSSLLRSEAYQSLTHRQARLLVTVLFEYNRQIALDSNDENRPSVEEFGDKAFFFNRALYLSYGLYETHSEDFTADMKVLRERGFIELVQSGWNLRQKNVYKASRKWEGWKQ